MLLQTLLNDIEKLVNSSVVKFEHKAKEAETAKSLRYADMYISVMNGTDRYETYPFFDAGAIISAGIPHYDPASTMQSIGVGILDSYQIQIPAEGLSPGNYWVRVDGTAYSFTLTDTIPSTDSLFIGGNTLDHHYHTSDIRVFHYHENMEYKYAVVEDQSVGTGLSIIIIPEPSVQYSATDIGLNKKLIPVDKRDAVVEAQRILTKQTYESEGDMNNYYRMLSGFPDMDAPVILLTDAEYELIGITETADKVAIHKLSVANINRLVSKGVVAKYIEMYPEDKYLNYLGANKINSLTARQAKNFTLLKTTTDVPSSVYDLFNSIYDQNRDYVVNIIYNNDIYSSYELYDNFIALVIMVMTIQRVISASFKKAIQRDLYDWTFIKNLYSSYNIPFLEDLTMEQHVALTKNFNKLLQYKGTDKVLFDICSLLGHSEIKIEKYFLVKAQQYDVNGNPIIDTEHPENQYELYFQAVDLGEENFNLALQDKTNYLSYEEVTEDDPYWWDSGNMKSDILEKEFNFIESKYISLNIMYNMTDILFDTAYAFRLILDKKTDIDTVDLEISLPRITSDKNFSLFDVMVFLIASTSRTNGFVGNIPTQGQISHIYGFNFNQTTINAIKTLVNNNRKYLSAEIIEYFNGLAPDTLSISNMEDVEKLYTNIRELRTLLVDGMYSTQSTEEYYVYKKIYDTILTENNVTSMFTVDGVTYTTYAAYIAAQAPELYPYLDNTSVYTTAERNSIVEHVLAQLEDAIPSFSNLSNIVNDIRPIYNAILALVKFFKSYTVDVHSFNIWYLMNDKYFNHIKMIDKIGHIDSYLWTKSNINGLYSDQGYMTAEITLHDYTQIREEYKLIYED